MEKFMAYVIGACIICFWGVVVADVGIRAAENVIDIMIGE